MTAPGGRRRLPQKRRLPRRTLALQGLGVLATTAAWVVLVRAAIDFGAMGRAGNAAAWAFTALATLGAVGCLLVTLLLSTRVLLLLGVLSDSPAHRGRRRH